MATVTTALAPSFTDIMGTARFAPTVCVDPMHDGMHHSLVQYMTSVVYHGHKVAITLDGDVFDVRIDDKPSTVKRGLSRDALEKYVNERC